MLYVVVVVLAHLYCMNQVMDLQLREINMCNVFSANSNDDDLIQNPVQFVS